jgi:glutathione S-transferase
MKLYLNKASPYARLSLVVAHEKDLAGKTELVWVDPWALPEALLAVSPVGRVPVLVTDEGVAIPDSTAICDYLDAAGGGRALLPPAPRRAEVLGKCGLGRGLIELAFGVTIEKRFHPDAQPLGERWVETLGRTAKHLESQAARLNADEPDLGDLCIAVGLSYTVFRVPQVEWRAACPKLAAWQARMEARPSMRATAPE